MNKYLIGILSLLVVASLMLVGCGAGTGQAVKTDFCTQVKQCAATTTVPTAAEKDLSVKIDNAAIAVEKFSEQTIDGMVNGGLKVSESVALAKKLCPTYIKTEQEQCAKWNLAYIEADKQIKALTAGISSFKAGNVGSPVLDVAIKQEATLKIQQASIIKKYTYTCMVGGPASEFSNEVLSYCVDGINWQMIKLNCKDFTSTTTPSIKCPNGCTKDKFAPIALGGVCN